MFEVGTEELLRLLPGVFGGQCTPLSSMEQDEALVTKAEKISVEESQLCFATCSASVIHNRVRGFSSWPGVWSVFQIGNGAPERIKLLTTRIADLNEANADSTVMNDAPQCFIHKNRLFVSCAGETLIEVLELQLPGKRPVDTKAFINGLRGSQLTWVPQG